MLTWRRRARPGGREVMRRDGGLTLVELLVAMGIFSIVIAISGAMLRGMTQATVRVASVNDARTEADRLYNRLDKQVPYAEAISVPGASGGDWWIEFRTDVPAGGQPLPRCWQYRLDTSERVVESRSWPPGQPAAVTGWSVLVTNAQARTGTGAPRPFQMITADATRVRQQLVVALDIAGVGAPVVPLDTSYVARNRAEDITAVCTEVGRS